MLLRLLPLATPQQPSPPTILFTLPLQTHPYTSRSLPLPANLHAHRSLCLQEDIDCPNVLLGEKASWVGGVIDDVTFSLSASTITARFIDGTATDIPLSPECIVQLQRVIQEVHLSFQPAPQAPAPAQIARQSESSPRSSVSSSSSATSNASSASSNNASSSIAHKKSTGSLLLSFLSPLLSSAPGAPVRAAPVAAQQLPAKVHRRQARSLLVDAYRRYVLPVVKDQLPEAYLPWAITSETRRHQSDFEVLRGDINATLAQAGMSTSFATPMKRVRSESSSSSSHSGDLSDSDSDCLDSPITPATSIFSPSPSECSSPFRPRDKILSPAAFLTTLPSPHSCPVTHRTAYSSQMARLTLLVTRMGSIKKLNARYEREEGKRKWLESLERGRAGDKAIRRAVSNGRRAPGCSTDCTPLKRSGLWRSWTADDQERAEIKENAKEYLHPAMMDSIEECSVSSDEDQDEEGSVEHDEVLLTPMEVERSMPRIELPSRNHLIDVDEDPFSVDQVETDLSKMMVEKIIHVNSRPQLDRTDSLPPTLSSITPLPSLSALIGEDSADLGLMTPPSIVEIAKVHSTAEAEVHAKAGQTAIKSLLTSPRPKTRDLVQIHQPELATDPVFPTIDTICA